MRKVFDAEAPLNLRDKCAKERSRPAGYRVPCLCPVQLIFPFAAQAALEVFRNIGQLVRQYSNPLVKSRRDIDAIIEEIASEFFVGIGSDRQLGILGGGI